MIVAYRQNGQLHEVSWKSAEAAYAFASLLLLSGCSICIRAPH